MLRLLPLLALVLLPLPSSAQPVSPNIIFILADDLGYGDIGVHGQADIRTPSIDQLAAEGLRFTNAYAANPICAPSRCGLMTGLHIGHCMVDRNANPNQALRTEDVTVAEVLQGAGYTNAVLGKWGLGGELPASMGGGPFQAHSAPLAKGFDHELVYRDQIEAWFYYRDHVWLDDVQYDIPENQDGATGLYTHDWFAEDALAFVEENADGPFYLQLSYTIPHARVEVPELGDYAEEEWPWIEQTFAAMVTRMDEDIGELVALLDELGIAEQTLVIFSSDNGPHEAETDGSIHDAEFFDSAGGLRGHKHDLFEGGIRVPFIARWAGTIAPGGVDDRVTVSTDFLPTAAELAGVASPQGIDGISMAPTLTGIGTQEELEYRFWQHNGDWGGAGEPTARYAIRQGDWKYVQLFDGVGLLYDLAVDEAETTDVAADHPDVVADMEAIVEVEATGPLFPVKPLLTLTGDVECSTADLPDDPDYVPVLYLRFEEGSDGDEAWLVYDSSPGPVGTGTVSGGATYSSDVPRTTIHQSGESNLASLDLDASQPSVVEIPHQASLGFGLASFTAEAWVQLDTLASGITNNDRQWLAVKKELGTDDETINYAWLAQVGAAAYIPTSYGKTEGHTGREMALIFGNDNGRLEGLWTAVSQLEIADHDWHHVSVAYDAPGQTVRFTLDDQVDEVVIERHGHLINAGPLVLGAHPGPDGGYANGLDGKIDEFRLGRGVVPLNNLLRGYAPDPIWTPYYTLDFGSVQEGLDPVTLSFQVHHAAEQYAHLLEGEVSDSLVHDDRLTVEEGTFGPLADGGISRTYSVTLDPADSGDLEGDEILVEGWAGTYGFDAVGSPATVHVVGTVLKNNGSGDDDDFIPDDDDDGWHPEDDDDGRPPEPDDDGCECALSDERPAVGLVLLGVLALLGRRRRMR